jgi:hypothetical protein
VKYGSEVSVARRADGMKNLALCYEKQEKLDKGILCKDAFRKLLSGKMGTRSFRIKKWASR